jgi:hypothetical protein
MRLELDVICVLSLGHVIGCITYGKVGLINKGGTSLGCL